MEKELISLVKDILNMDEMHQQYQDNDINCVLDLVKKDENTFVLTVSLKENKDKKEFEHWADSIDDELFDEVWNSLSNLYDLHDLNQKYESDDTCKYVIELFKNEAKKLAKQKIAKLTKILED